MCLECRTTAFQGGRREESLGFSTREGDKETSWKMGESRVPPAGEKRPFRRQQSQKQISSLEFSLNKQRACTSFSEGTVGNQRMKL